MPSIGASDLSRAGADCDLKCLPKDTLESDAEGYTPTHTREAYNEKDQLMQV